MEQNKLDQLIEELIYKDFLSIQAKNCETIQELIKRIRKAKQDFGKNCFIYLATGDLKFAPIINSEMKTIKFLSKTQNIDWMKDKEDLDNFEMEKSNFKFELSSNVALFIKREPVKLCNY